MEGVGGRRLHTVHIPRDASASVRTTSPSGASSEARKEERERKKRGGSEGILAAQRRAGDWRKQTMAPAATSPLALLCLCSLSLCGPAGSASPTQVRTTQWLLYGLERVAVLLPRTHFRSARCCFAPVNACARVREANGENFSHFIFFFWT